MNRGTVESCAGNAKISASTGSSLSFTCYRQQLMSRKVPYGFVTDGWWNLRMAPLLNVMIGPSEGHFLALSQILNPSYASLVSVHWTIWRLPSSSVCREPSGNPLSQTMANGTEAACRQGRGTWNVLPWSDASFTSRARGESSKWVMNARHRCKMKSTSARIQEDVALIHEAGRVA